MGDFTASRRRQSEPSTGDLSLASRLAHPLEEWYRGSGRDFPWRHWRDEYRLTVTEILLQRTRAEAVAELLPAYFDAYPDWGTLARAEEVAVAAVLQPIGLHQRRATSLIALARDRVADPSRPRGELAGVGQYVDRAVDVAMTGARRAMVDSNFVRLIDRVFGGPWMSDYRFDTRLQGIAQAVVDVAEDARAVNWAVLDLGATTCRPRAPRCEHCPLSALCRTARRAS